MKRLIYVVAVLVVLGGCKSSDAANSAAEARAEEAAKAEASAQANAERATVKKVDGGAARELVGAGATLLDVRTPSEFESGHIDGAKLLPVQELGSRIGEVGDKETPVVVYCASGRRSAAAAKMLSEAGYTKVYDLGSIRSW